MTLPRRHRELTDEDIRKIADTYHRWRSIDNGKLRIENGEFKDNDGDELLLVAEESEEYKLSVYEDVQGFCKSATIEEIRENDYVLTPGRYVGIEEVEDDGIPFEEKMENLTTELTELFKKSHQLEEEIRKNLGGIGYEI